jgi:FKBP-type peptidyl-prolyl cis-trans isomerase
MRRLGFLLVAFAAFACAAAAADNSLSLAANKVFLATNAKQPGVVVRPDGLQYRIIQSGFGKQPQPRDYVTVYYTGKLINGTVFDGTEPGMPVRFRVDTLISGWSEALQLMRVGDHWQVVVPSDLAYGEQGTPDGAIPPNQTLVFDLELVKCVPPKLVPVKPDENPDKVDDNKDLGPDDDEDNQ